MWAKSERSFLGGEKREPPILAAIKINNNEFCCFSEEVLCDIKIETDDSVIVCAHKVVLVSGSQYFRSMFTGFAEGNKDIINLRELDSNILQLLVNYIYTGKIMVTEKKCNGRYIV